MILRHSWATKYFWAQPNNLKKIPKKYKNNGMIGFQGKVIMEIESGVEGPDILGCSGGMLVVTDKVLKVFKKYNFQKYGIYDVEMVDARKGKGVIPHYNGVYFSGKGGKVDDEKSQTTYHEFPGGKKMIKKINGIYFDINKWDGSDLFQIELYGGYLITKKVKKAFEKEGIKGYSLQRLVDFKTEF